MTDMNECIADTVSGSDVLPAIGKNYEALIDEVRGQNENVRIMAVTKTQSVEKINYLIENCGLALIGENRVNELLDKYDRLAKPHGGKLEIHFIGTLQKNKVKYIIDKVDMIESLDSEALAAEIERQAAKHDRIMDVLIEVNIGREPQKGGVAPEKLNEFVEKLALFPHIRVRGLMTIAPKSDDREKILKYFIETYQYFIDISQKKIHNICMDVLSMGMSGSYREAIKAHATQIRVGSLLFGERK